MFHIQKTKGGLKLLFRDATFHAAFNTTVSPWNHAWIPPTPNSWKKRCTISNPVISVSFPKLEHEQARTQICCFFSAGEKRENRETKKRQFAKWVKLHPSPQKNVGDNWQSKTLLSHTLFKIVGSSPSWSSLYEMGPLPNQLEVGRPITPLTKGLFSSPQWSIYFTSFL